MKLTQAELAQKIGSINLGEELKKAIERYEQLDIWTSSLFQLME